MQFSSRLAVGVGVLGILAGACGPSTTGGSGQGDGGGVGGGQVTRDGSGIQGLDAGDCESNCQQAGVVVCSTI